MLGKGVGTLTLVSTYMQKSMAAYTQTPWHRDGVPKWAKDILSIRRIFSSQASSVFHIWAVDCIIQP